MALAIGGALLGTAAGFAIRHFGDDAIEDMLGDTDDNDEKKLGVCMNNTLFYSDCPDLNSEACKASKYCTEIEVAREFTYEPCIQHEGTSKCITDPDYAYPEKCTDNFGESCDDHCATLAFDDCQAARPVEMKCSVNKETFFKNNSLDCMVAHYDEFCGNFT